MSALKDINLWEFLDSRNFNSTENLKELSVVLLQDKDTLMKASSYEYEEWLDELPEVEMEEEFEEIPFDVERPTLLG